MDWNVFWSAFGAVGTTIGSLITAIAVVIAVRQYRQPIEKKMSMKVSCSIVPFKGNFIVVEFYNKGVRKFTINSIYVKGKKSKLYLNLMQKLTEYTGNLPITVDVEECGKLFFVYDDFFSEISKYVKSGELRKHGKIMFVGELYCGFGKWHVQGEKSYCARCGQKIDWSKPKEEEKRRYEKQKAKEREEHLKRTGIPYDNMHETLRRKHGEVQNEIN